MTRPLDPTSGPCCPAGSGTPTTMWGRIGSMLVARWPSLLALVLLPLGGDGGVAALGPVLMLLPVEYLLALRFGRRWSWAILVGVLAVYVGLRVVDVAGPQTVAVVLAGAALGVVLVHGGGPRETALQVGGLVLFGGLSCAAAVAAPSVAVWLVAGGWLAHAVWDVVHLYRDAVVSRTYAEWCGLVDVLTAGAVVIGALGWAW